MTPSQFWYDEEELLDVYIKAYYEKSNYEAWIQGQYTYVATVIATANALGGEKGSLESYPEYDTFLGNKNIQEEHQKIKDNDNKFISQFY